MLRIHIPFYQKVLDTAVPQLAFQLSIWSINSINNTLSSAFSSLLI